MMLQKLTEITSTLIVYKCQNTFYPSNILNVPKSVSRVKNESGDAISDRKKRGVDRRKRVEGDAPKTRGNNPVTRPKLTSVGHTSVKFGKEVGPNKNDEITLKKAYQKTFYSNKLSQICRKNNGTFLPLR